MFYLYVQLAWKNRLFTKYTNLSKKTTIADIIDQKKMQNYKKTLS